MGQPKNRDRDAEESVSFGTPCTCASQPFSLMREGTRKKAEKGAEMLVSSGMRKNSENGRCDLVSMGRLYQDENVCLVRNSFGKPKNVVSREG